MCTLPALDETHSVSRHSAGKYRYQPSPAGSPTPAPPGVMTAPAATSTAVPSTGSLSYSPTTLDTPARLRRALHTDGVVLVVAGQGNPACAVGHRWVRGGHQSVLLAPVSFLVPGRKIDPVCGSVPAHQIFVLVLLWGGCLFAFVGKRHTTKLNHHHQNPKFVAPRQLPQRGARNGPRGRVELAWI